MNGVVDAVFGPPKQELIKLSASSQRSAGNATDLATGVDANDSPAPETVEAHIPHDFQETTSFRPCICAHCNGLVIKTLLLETIQFQLCYHFFFQLWAPLRQSYKCRECGLTAHKLCIEVVKSSCRPKSMETSPFSTSINGTSRLLSKFCLVLYLCSFLAETFLSTSIRTGFRRRKKLSSQSDIDSLESGFVAMDCSCDHNCQSPCTRRPSVNSIRQTLYDGLTFRSQGNLSYSIAYARRSLYCS